MGGFRSTISGIDLPEGHINYTDRGTKVWEKAESELFDILCKGNLSGRKIMTNDLVAGMDLLEQDLHTSSNRQELAQTHRNFLSFLDTIKGCLKDRVYRAYENLSDLEKTVRDRVMGRMANPMMKEDGPIKLITPEYTNGIDLSSTTKVEEIYRNRFSSLESSQ